MKNKTLFQLYSHSRTTGSNKVTQLAAILIFILLLVSQQASKVRADATSLQLSPQITQLPTTPVTTLYIATSADYFPMEYMDGEQIVGRDIDLMNAIAAKMNVTIVYINLPFYNLLDNLIAGDYDAVISTLTVVPAREDVIDFTLPYVTFNESENIAIAVQQGNDLLKNQFNVALRQLRADGTLQTIIIALAADKPEWQPHLPAWEQRVFLPLVLRTTGN
jgi:ABC-type amino acid transport substrate-binding protein